MNQTPWTVRGISPELVKQVRLEAKGRDMYLGEAVTEALTSWLTNPPALTADQEKIQKLEERVERLEKQVMEMQGHPGE